MAWSKLEDSFRDHRKFKRMAEALKIHRAEARGMLAGLWSWATTQAPDGDLSDFTEPEIEEAMDWQGEAGAAIREAVIVKLIDGPPFMLHDWMPRAGSFRKATQKQKERQQKREGEAKRQSRDRRTPARKSVAGEKRREERRREETTASSATPSALVPASPSVICLISTKGDYPITAEDIKGWAVSFPGVDVSQELRNMREWCISNPKKRKTPGGMRKFVTAWLTREQNRGGGRKNQPAPRHGTTKDVTERSRKRIEDDRRDPAGEAKAREIISNLTQIKGIES